MKRLTLLVTLFAATGALSAQPPDREKTPEPLRPWVDWVLKGHEQEHCPFFQGHAERRACAWPSHLSLEIDDRTGRFTQQWLIHRETWVPLPGDLRTWPLDVRIDGAPTAVIVHDGGPSAFLTKGRHTLSGQFAWAAPPPLLQVPQRTGLLRLTLRGRTVPFPARDVEGRVWLEKRIEAEESRVEVLVVRHLLDEVPLILTTRIEFAISGESREEVFGPVLPAGFVPLALTGPLPARIENDGTLRLQLRPGRFTLDLVARHQGPASVIEPPVSPQPWDQEEIWVFEARPDLRVASIEDVPGIDPQQTTLPEEWKRHPAYLVKGGDRIRIVEKHRGDANPAPDQLTLTREWWLDFDGKGGTVHDVIEGRMSRSWRLTMGPPLVLGRAEIAGQDQFVTRLAGGGPPGIEVRQGLLHLEADSRVEGRPSNLSAVGWDQDFTQVTGRLNLGPGWRLFHAWGVDDVTPSWISRGICSTCSSS